MQFYLHFISFYKHRVYFNLTGENVFISIAVPFMGLIK